MQRHVGTGFTAGVLGAVILIAIMGLMQLVGQGPATFVGIYTAAFGATGVPALTWVIAALLFAISGGIWGAIFTLLVSQPTIGKGMLFGIVPALWLWLVIAPFMGQPMFFGFQAMKIVLPVVFNVIIWGSFVGWYCRRRTVPAHSSAGHTAEPRAEGERV